MNCSFLLLLSSLTEPLPRNATGIWLVPCEKFFLSWLSCYRSRPLNSSPEKCLFLNTPESWVTYLQFLSCVKSAGKWLEKQKCVHSLLTCGTWGKNDEKTAPNKVHSWLLLPVVLNSISKQLSYPQTLKR